MNEDELKARLAERLRDAHADRSLLPNFSFIRTSSKLRNLGELVDDFTFDMLVDRSEWNPDPKFMVEIIGGMIPDIVLRSKTSGENRIYYSQR